MTHEYYKELLAANALTALDAEDARALETHLASCADCRSEMVGWEETAAFLALDAAPFEPSARLRERIRESVRAEGRSGKLTDDHAEVSAETRVGVGDSRVLAFERPPRNVWTSLGT